jgi:hypothetical protein
MTHVQAFYLISKYWLVYRLCCFAISASNFFLSLSNRCEFTLMRMEGQVGEHSQRWLW